VEEREKKEDTQIWVSNGPPKLLLYRRIDSYITVNHLIYVVIIRA